MPADVAAKKDPAALYLIDSSIYIFRAWHMAAPGATDSSGLPANAAIGFVTFLFELLGRRRPQLLACAFDDTQVSSQRKAHYPQYKANRPPAPAALRRQFSLCRGTVQAMGISNYASHSVEADDIIGTLAASADAQGMSTVIVSADKDLCQFVGERDAMWDFARDQWLDRRQIINRFGVRPAQIPDLLALAGDKVDNIPGIPGVGLATAARLLLKWGNLETLLANAHRVAQMKFRGAPRVAELLTIHQQTARTARQLTGLHSNQALRAELPADCRRLTLDPDYPLLDDWLQRLQFSSTQRMHWRRLLEDLAP